MHWETYLCTGKHICALKNIFVHWETYLCTGKHICALKNIFLHWETYLCTEKHICALKIYICALKNMSVMCSDQYICTEIFICALHIWATVHLVKIKWFFCLGGCVLLPRLTNLLSRLSFRPEFSHLLDTCVSQIFIAL